MKKITLLISASCSIVFPEIAKLLRSNKEYDFRIVGIDAREHGPAEIYADAFYSVPMGDQGKQYIDAVISVCEKENVQIILPISDEENLTLSKHIGKFEEKNIKVLVNTYEKTALALNKPEALNFLKQGGVEVPDWRVPKSLEELELFMDELGFPDKDIVIKPIQARGSRGFHIIRDGYDEAEAFLTKSDVFASKEHCLNALKNIKPFPSVFLMEFLPGVSYSIDLLTDKGKILACMPHKRMGYKWGCVDHAVIAHHEECYAMCKEIVELFAFDNLINIELGISDQGKPLLIEINPRASATLSLNAMTGIDIMHHAIKIQMEGKTELPDKYEPAEYIISDLNTLLKTG